MVEQSELCATVNAAANIAIIVIFLTKIAIK
jgi:hypothetical protein